MIDSDGHVLPHLGVEIKSVNAYIFEEMLKILKNIGISPKTKKREAIENSYSANIRYIIYIPSAEMKSSVVRPPQSRFQGFQIYIANHQDKLK
jgi:hypothetical protein